MSSILRTVGIDISKDWLDAFAAPEGRASRFSNDSAGFRKLIAWIGSGIDRIAYEPTGAFHRDFEDTLLKAGLPLYAINPFQVRSFARSIGRRAKTDAVDARLLATMAAAVEDLRPTEARSEGQRDLAELQQIRAVIYRHFPLSRHSLSFEAAVAAECAREQGRFPAIHRALFARPLSGESLPLSSLMAEGDIPDATSFRACMSDPTSVAREGVRADLARIRTLSVRGTPALQIGDRIATGGITAAELVERVRAAADANR